MKKHLEDQEKLEALRREIAQVTREIIQLAGKREEAARDVGAIKERLSLPLENRTVEDALVAQVMLECERVGLDRRTGLRILTALIEDSKNVQASPGVAKPSPGSVLAKALALQREGVKLVRLDVGEPDFHPPRAVLRACSRALFSFRTHYTEPRGIPELRGELAEHLKRKYRFTAADEELTVTPSGRFAVYAALSHLVGEGESAMVVEPNWPAYADSLRQLHARAVIIHTTQEEGWTPSIERIQEAVRPDTKVLILSYPNNPTGRVIPAKLYRSIVRLADDLGLTVLSDEIYNDYSTVPCPSILEEKPRRFVLTSSFSKTWSMTGFRIGFAVSSPETISAISDLTSLVITSVPEFIQWGAIKALGADSDVRRNVDAMKKRIKVACGALDRIPDLEYTRPDGAMYVFPKLRSGEPGDAFAERLLTGGVSVTPGIAFGDYPSNFRISLGQPAREIEKGIRKMGELLS